jgi:hypothetical protein
VQQQGKKLFRERKQQKQVTGYVSWARFPTRGSLNLPPVSAAEYGGGMFLITFGFLRIIRHYSPDALTLQMIRRLVNNEPEKLGRKSRTQTDVISSLGVPN